MKTILFAFSLSTLVLLSSVLAAEPDDTNKLAAAWEPPTDQQPCPGGWSNNGPGLVAHFITEKPIKEVWEYYAKKLGIDRPYKIKNTWASYSKDDVILIAENRRGEGDHDELLSTLIRRADGKSITICLACSGGRVMVFVTIQPSK